MLKLSSMLLALASANGDVKVSGGGVMIDRAKYEKNVSAMKSLMEMAKSVGDYHQQALNAKERL